MTVGLFAGLLAVHGLLVMTRPRLVLWKKIVDFPNLITNLELFGNPAPRTSNQRICIRESRNYLR